MKFFLIITFISFSCFGQIDSFYNPMNDGQFQFYSQINEDPVLISHGNILSEQSLPNYAKGLQFMQAPGVFSSVNELYSYLSDNELFSFENSNNPGSYYNKNSSHNVQKNKYYNDGVSILNKSLSYSNDEDAKNDAIYDLISDVRFQLVFQETYLKDSNYEFLVLSTVNVFSSDIDVNSSVDIKYVYDIFSKTADNSLVTDFRKHVELYCLIKENGNWKACSLAAHLNYISSQGYLDAVTNKLNSTNFYDVISKVENGVRIHQ